LRLVSERGALFKSDGSWFLHFFPLVFLRKYKTTGGDLNVIVYPDRQAVIKTGHMLTVFCTYHISVINLVNMQMRMLTKGLAWNN